MTQIQTTQSFAPLAINVREAARMLSISRTKVFELLKNGDVQAFKLGGKLLFRVSEVERLVADATPAREARHD